MSDETAPEAQAPVAPAPIDLRPLHDAWELAKAEAAKIKTDGAAEIAAVQAAVAARVTEAEARVEAAHAAFVAPVAPGAVLSTSESPAPVTVVLGGHASVVTPHFLGAYTPPTPAPVVAGAAGGASGTGA